MKIAVVVSTFPPYKGGMGNVADDHAQIFSEAGHEVSVFAPGVSLTRIIKWGNAALAPQLLWKLRGFDVVELHYPFYGGAEWVWLWKRIFGRRKRLIVMYHMDTVGSGWLGVIFHIYRALLLKPILAAADRIIVTSRDYLASSYASFLADDPRVAEVPLSVDIARFPQSAGRSKKALFVGGLDHAHYFKGVENLLLAFARVSHDVPDAELAIVGDGDMRKDYEARARGLGLGSRVKFLGGLSDESLVDAYRSASFLVLPSVDRSEAFGLVILEAAACGTPAIVSDLPGVRTVVAAGETGLIIPPGDVAALAAAMRKLFTESALSEDMGRAARTRAERQYSKEAVSSKLSTLIAE